MLRWSQGPKLWELSYLSIHAVGHAGIITTLFVAISVAVPKNAGAGAITTYYLAQQVGMVVGVTATAVFTRKVFRNGLLREFAMEPNANEVRVSGLEWVSLSREADAAQMIEDILRDSRFAFTHLSDKLQVVVANSYCQAFLITPGR